MRKGNRSTKYISSSGKHGCIHCWKCFDSCPVGVFGKVNVLWHKHIKVVNPDACIGCGKCVKVCPRELFEFRRDGDE